MGIMAPWWIPWTSEAGVAMVVVENRKWLWAPIGRCNAEFAEYMVYRLTVTNQPNKYINIEPPENGN